MCRQPGAGLANRGAPTRLGPVSEAGLAFCLAIASLAVGPLLAWKLERREPLRAALDGFVLVMTAGLSLLFLLPHAYLDMGLWAFPVALLGFLLPRIAERSLRPTRSETSRLVLSLAVAGLLFHCAIDGAALATAAGGSMASASPGQLEVTLAIVSHRLPVGLFVWSVVSPAAGRGSASAGLLGLMAATAAGFVVGPQLLSATGGDVAVAGVVEALLAGGLLHVVVEHRPQAPESSMRETWAGAGALAAIALFVLLPLDPHPALAQSWEAGRRLFVEASPAILVGFLGAGLLSLVPQRTLSRWMRGRTALGSAMRGVVFGLRERGARVTVLNRTVDKAEALARELGADGAGALDALADTPCDVLVNTTSVGLGSDASPVPAAALPRGALVMDAVYDPPDTRLLRDAAAAGCATVGGKWMLVEQAAEQVRLWTGRDAPVEAMAAAFDRAGETAT